jgi:hypothetical protein
MRHLPAPVLILTAAAWAAGGCATSRAEPEAPPWAAGNRWRGPAADANRAALATATPALGAVQGRVPLVALSTEPSSEATAEPRYDVALFDDGTLVYAGHRCVKVGGRLIARLPVAQLAEVRTFLAGACKDLDRTTDDQVCDDGGVRIACSDGRALLSGSDRCRRSGEVGQRLAGIAAALAERLGLAAWLGAPTERQACGPGAADLAPPALATTLVSVPGSAR